MWINKNETPSQVIKKPRVLTIGGVDYPSAIFSKYSELELNALDIFKLTEDTIPNRRYYSYSETINESINNIDRVAIDKPIDSLKELFKQELIQTAKSMLDTAVAKYSAGEMASWSTLEKEAVAYLGGELITNCPMLEQEALLCGQDNTVLANEIVANAEALKTYRTFVVSERYNRTAIVNSFTTVDEFKLYEATPYNYTITIDDIDEMSTYVVGAIVVRYKNNVTDWS